MERRLLLVMFLISSYSKLRLTFVTAVWSFSSESSWRKRLLKFYVASYVKEKKSKKVLRDRDSPNSSILQIRYDFSRASNDSLILLSFLNKIISDNFNLYITTSCHTINHLLCQSDTLTFRNDRIASKVLFYWDFQTSRHRLRLISINNIYPLKAKLKYLC